MKIRIICLLLLAQMWNVYAQPDQPAPGVHDFVFVTEEPEPLNLGEVRKLIGYPMPAIKRGIEGKIYCRILVDEKGHYVTHKFTRKAHPILMDAVNRHLAQLRFRPAYVYERPTSYWMNIPFEFSIAHGAVSSINRRKREVLYLGGRNLKKAKIYFDSGLMYLEVQEYGAALQMFEQSLKFNPLRRGKNMAGIGLRFYAQLMRAQTQAMLGQIQSALEGYTEAIGLGTTYPDSLGSLLPYLSQAYLGRALVYLQRGQAEQAVSDYNWVLSSMQPGTLWEDDRLCELRLALDPYEKGIDMEREYQLARDAGQNELAIYLRGAYAMHQAQYEQAMYAFEQLCQRAERPELQLLAWCRKAQIYHRRELYQQALTAIQEAMDLDTSHPLPHFLKGIVLARLQGGEAYARAYFSSSEKLGISGQYRIQMLKALSQPEQPQDE